MKYIRVIPYLITACVMYSCLLNNPAPRESIRMSQFGEVVAGGDIGVRLQASLKSLLAAHPDLDRIFATGGVCPSREAGETLLGVVLMSRAAGKDAAEADKVYKAITSHLNVKGYLGDINPGVPEESRITGHGILIRGLTEYYLWTGESGALDLAQTICDSLLAPLAGHFETYPRNMSDRVVPDTVDGQPVVTNGWLLSYDEPGNIFAAIDALAQFYSLRKSQNCKDVLDELCSLYIRGIDDAAGIATAPYLVGLKGLLRYGEARGDKGYAAEAEDAWKVFRDGTLNYFYGAPRILGDTAGGSCPAAVSEAYICAVWLWALTGKSDYLEDAEKIFYNALMPAQTGTGNFTEMVESGQTGKLQRCEVDSCRCNRTWVEGLAQATRSTYFLRDNKILIPFYGTGELKLEEKGVHIIQTSGYPLQNTVRLEIVEAPKRGLNFQVHFPSYMTMKSMALNASSTISGTVNSIGLLEFRDVFRKGDVIELNYAFGSRWTPAREGEGGGKDMYKAVYGPLVFGYRSDTTMWLERGVKFEGSPAEGFVPDPSFGYRRDSISGIVDVLTAMSNENIAGTRQWEPPVFRPLYVPLARYGRGDILPEYILARISRED